MPCRLMCAVFPPASSGLSHSKLSIRTGSPHLDCISFVLTLSIPHAGEHGTQKLRPQVTAVLHSLPQNTGSFPQRDSNPCFSRDHVFAGSCRTLRLVGSR